MSQDGGGWGDGQNGVLGLGRKGKVQMLEANGRKNKLKRG